MKVIIKNETDLSDGDVLVKTYQFITVAKKRFWFFPTHARIFFEDCVCLCNKTKAGTRTFTFKHLIKK